MTRETKLRLRKWPLMIGESRHAMYFYFDAESSQWQGPFAPESLASAQAAQ